MTLALVEVLENEDGEVGWASGHIEPALMVLSAVATRMSQVGADEAMRMLLGEPDRYSGPLGQRRTYEDQAKRANGMLAGVQHLWLRQDPDNDENMLPVSEGEPGAEPWTRVDLPW